MDGTVVDDRKRIHTELRHFAHTLVLNSIVLLSKSCIILSTISYLEEGYKFGGDEAGESISAKINLLEVVEKLLK